MADESNVRVTISVALAAGVAGWDDSGNVRLLPGSADVTMSKSFITNYYSTIICSIFKLRSARPERNSSRAKFYRTAKT